MTLKDGSESLVFGKIFADIVGKDTERSNLGYIQKDLVVKDPGVFAAAKRIEYPDGVLTSEITDQYWINGFSRHANQFVVDRATSYKEGYELRDFYPGQHLTTPDGILREVLGVITSDQYITVNYSGEQVNTSYLNSPTKIQLYNQAYDYEPYYQQYGLQGKALSFLFQHVSFLKSADDLRFLFSALLAIVIVLVAAELGRSFSWLFAGCFFVSMMLSPQIIGFARNLYWATFLWFLPVYFSLVIYRKRTSKKTQYFFFLLFALSVALKCLAGYEYITTILIFSVFIYFIAPFTPSPAYSVRDSALMVSKFILFSIVGFIVAVALHLGMRADTLAAGVHNTFAFDAIKYLPIPTSANAHESISIFPVLKEYIFEWKLPFIYGFDAYYWFSIACFIVLGFLIVIKAFDSKLFARDVMLLCITFLAASSWFVIMVKHAKIHVHLDYVLWYLGFIPALLFVIAHGTLVVTKVIFGKMSKI